MSGPANSVVRHCPVLQFQSTPKIVQGRAGSDPKNYFWVGSLHLWIGLSRVKKIGPTSKLHSNTCMPDVTELLTRLSAYQIRQRSNENCRLHTSATAQNTKTRLLRLRSGDFCFLLQTSVDKTENTWKPEVSCCPMYCVAVKWNSCRIRFPNLVQIRWKLRTHSVVCQREPSWYRKRVTSWWLLKTGNWLFCRVRMSDVMSTSVESLMIDVATLDDEPSLVSSEQEPEAWSVTVDLKTLKKMTAKNIKRQDHIWGQSVSVAQGSSMMGPRGTGSQFWSGPQICQTWFDVEGMPVFIP